MSLGARALFLSNHYPDPAGGSSHGVFKRMGTFIRALTRSFDRVQLLFIVPPGADRSPELIARQRDSMAAEWGGDIELTLAPGAAAETGGAFSFYIKPMFGLRHQRSYRYAAGPEPRAAVDAALAARPAMVFVHRLYSLMPLLGRGRDLPPIALDLDEIEHRWFWRSIGEKPRWPLKRLQYLQMPAFRCGERRALGAVDRIFVCSTIDRDFLANRWGLAGARLIPNAVAMPADIPPPADAKTLMFLGAYGYPPNASAADYLIDRIWPLIHKACPEAKLIIAGGGPEHIAAYHRRPEGVEFTGFVDDLRALYGRTRVVVCPIRSGGGTRFKLIEGAAFGRALVSTTVGAEGLTFRPGPEIAIHDDEPGFAGACVSLLNDSAAAARAGEQARAAARRDYDVDAVVRGVGQEFADLLAARGRSAHSGLAEASTVVGQRD